MPAGPAKPMPLTSSSMQSAPTSNQEALRPGLPKRPQTPSQDDPLILEELQNFLSDNEQFLQSNQILGQR